jgi:hypothetical protein
MQITLSGKLMQVTPPPNVLDRDTLPYVYIFMRYRHCVHQLRWHRLKLLISTLMKMGNIFQVSRQFNIKELFHYDHSLLYSESWRNILHSHSLLINLGNRHYFNSLPELDCQLRKKLLRAQQSETPNQREQNMVNSFVESSLTVNLE